MVKKLNVLTVTKKRFNLRTDKSVNENTNFNKSKLFGFLKFKI